MAKSYELINDKTDADYSKTNILCKDVPVTDIYNNDDLYRLLAENARDIIFHIQLTPVFKYKYVSPSSTRIIGYTPEEFYADPDLWRKCIHPEDTHILTDFTELDNPPNNEYLVYRCIRKDNKVIWTENSFTMIRNEDSKVIAVQIIARDITERKQAMEELRESEAFNSSLLENAPHATMVINPDTSIKYVNPAWEKVNGWTLDEIIDTKAPYPWWPEDMRETNMSAFLEAMKQGSGKGEVIAQKKNGELYWIEINWVSITHNGDFEYLLINSVDITERKRAEEKQQAIIKTALDGFWICALDGKFLEVNDSYCKMIGYTREELLNMYIYDIEARENLEQTLLRINNVKKQGSDRFETQHRRKDGKIIDIEVSVNYMDIDEGQLCVFVRDITERKRSEEALANEAIRRRILVEQSSDGIVILDKNGKVYEANLRFAEMLGYTSEEVLQLYVWDWDTQFSHEELLGMLHDIDEAGDHFETYHRRKDGSICDVEISTNGVTFGGQKLVFCVCRDITERKRSERTLQEERQRAQNYLDIAGTMLLALDSEGTVTLVNRKGCEILEYDENDIIGKNWFDNFVPARIRNSIKDNFQRTMNGEIGFVERGTDHAVVSRSGKKKMISWRDSLVKDDEGKRIGTLSSGEDITKRLKAEEALRESEEKFSKAFNASPEVIVISRLNDGKILEVNDSFVRSSGYTRDEAIGHSAEDISLWSKAEDRKKFIQVIKTRGAIRNQEFEFKTKSGELRTVLLSGEIINIGNDPCILIATNDITERKMTEKALADSEKKFSTAFHGSPDMMIITSIKDGKYVEVNDTFVNTTGYTREELIGHSNDEFDMWVDPSQADRMMQILEKNSKFRSEEFVFRMKSGELLTWLCSADIIDIGGEPCMLAVATDITRRKKVQEALRESEEKFSKAFLSSPNIMAITTLDDGKYVEVNNSHTLFTGYDPDEIIGRTSSEINIWAKPKDRDRMFKILREQGRLRNEEFDFRMKSGEIRTWLFSAEPITIGGEKCLIGVSTDITERKQAESQIRLLSSITQQVSDATVISDLDFNITYINQATQDLLGYSIDEVRGKGLGVFNPKPIRKRNRQKILQVLSSGQVWTGTVIKKRKDGILITCESKLFPLYDDNGQISSYIDILRDVTEQKEVEAKLQIQKQLNEQILDTMPEGVLVVDGNDHLILANKAFHRIFHTNKRATNNKLLGETFLNKYLNTQYNTVKHGRKDSNMLEFRHQVSDIEKIIICNIIKMDGEQTLLTFTDISKEREEEEKLYLTDRLASIGEMAAGLAHELNNPLTGVLALSQLLIDSDIPEEYKEDLHGVYSEAQRAAGIVKNVLLFTRNNNYENGRASVNEVIRNVLRLREYEERVYNISVVTNLQDNLPFAPIDKYQLQQVFLNMILNAEAAIKETGRAGTLTVTTEKINNHINIYFKDDGCGIKKSVLPRIFDPFFTTKDIGKGTGLGLSICYGIVVKHGGKISVETQINEGTTFTIRMPAVT